MSVGRPQVVPRDRTGFQEPWEQLMLDVSNEGMGSVMELLGNRAAIVQSVDPIADRVRITAEIPARQLIGLRSRMLTATQGEAILQHSFLRWDDAREDTRSGQWGFGRQRARKVTFHAAEQLCQRGILFHEPGDEVYEGQIVGENARDNDLTVNIVKAKAFSNVRENKDATVVLKASRKMTLEEMLEYCERDELVEVTPESLRLRKKLLKEAERRGKPDRRRREGGRYVVSSGIFQSDLQIPRRHVVVFCDDAFGPQSDRWVDLLPTVAIESCLCLTVDLTLPIPHVGRGWRRSSTRIPVDLNGLQVSWFPAAKWPRTTREWLNRSWVPFMPRTFVVSLLWQSLVVARCSTRLVSPPRSRTAASKCSLPTTTLAQDDAGIGVKNGVNHHNEKNWQGCLRCPPP